MKTFIEYVAEDLISRYGNNLNSIIVVFPNKRASLFLNEAFTSYSDLPVFTPKYYTISELFSDASEYIVGDRIELVCLLYKVYKEITNSEESLDRFFPWGEVIINDFDDIDKHLLDAKSIFTNVKDLHELDDISLLSKEQVEILKHFFPDYEGNNTHLKEKFLKLWSKLAEIYTKFKENMQRAGIMYEGALYRDVTETSNHESPDAQLGKRPLSHLNFHEKNNNQVYCFVGFNHLLPVEEKLFKTIKDNAKTLFYWDYDKFYIENHEAGENIKKNLVLFPNALTGRDEIYNNFSKPKDIKVLTSSTDNLQARFVNDWMDEDNHSRAGRKTVVVLADESLLPTVIHSLPKSVDKANITIGYNLAFTEIPLMINQLFTGRNYKKAETLTQKLSFLATSIHNKAIEDSTLPQDSALLKLRKESLFRTFTLINRLQRLSEANILEPISDTTLQRLLLQLINTTSVPFHGEPLEGVQIMGVLETRNLDFDNILLLSCNEGIMPKTSDSPSFIPYFLRKAYGLTTIENKVSTYSYHFHRLLQRCQNATLIWNKSTEGMHRGEMSRFILQLMVETNHQISRLALSTGQTAQLVHSASIVKTPEIISTMKERFARNLSPTAINTYLRCQKKFYYHYVLQLQEYDDPEELDKDNRTFGNIFHDAVHQLYSPFVKHQITASQLNSINNTENIRNIVTQCYIKELNKTSKAPSTEKFKFDGLQSIKIEVLTQYISRLINIDTKLAPFTILALEQNITEKFPIKIGQETFTTNIGGIIDRLDLININGTPAVRVVDYKTGAAKFDMKLTCVNDIFNPKFIKYHSDYYLQTYLYSTIIHHHYNLTAGDKQRAQQSSSSSIFVREPQKPDNQSVADCSIRNKKPIYPALLFIQHASSADHNPIIHFKGSDIEPIDKHDDEFCQSLHNLVDEMFSQQAEFVPVSNTEAATDTTCAYCPFRTICQ